MILVIPLPTEFRLGSLAELALQLDKMMEHIQIRCNTTQVHNLQIQIVVLLRGNFAHPISCLENDPLHTVLRVGVARPVAPRAVVGLFTLSPDEALLLLGARPDRLHALSVSERQTDSQQHKGWMDRGWILSSRSRSAEE